ncbi:DEAD/DEAH box helicase [Haloechinothrix salitolerans]|uniref:DEAD/DEAH box helicase n=1 Tax=Haloechinothrix salitolerans TaxID=926830 RepID=A0ABW2C7T0_9PSEU
MSTNEHRPQVAITDLVSYGASPTLAAIWQQHITTLTDVQERSVRAGALDGGTNLLVVAPTSSGKTFVGEMAAASSALAHRKHSIFIVPFKALADEHYELFKSRYGALLSVVISTADWTEFDSDIRVGNFNLAVMTYEKLLGLLVSQPNLVLSCSSLVVDEVQLLADEHRGPKLEFLLTRVMQSQHPPQIVALSASLNDINRLNVWLDAQLVLSTDRPIPLTQHVCDLSGSALEVHSDGAVSSTSLIAPQADRDVLAAALAGHIVDQGGQVLVFRSTVRKVAETASEIQSRLPATGLSAELSERFAQLEDSDSVNALRRCLASGVGFHTADLTFRERKLVEDAFRSGEVRALVATTTLAMGVNLPSDAVIVADTTRPVPAPQGWANQGIEVSEYRNAVGRAGRLGKRTAGQAYLLADHEIEQRQLVNTYILGEVEPVKSRIPSRPFADLVFDVVCAELASTTDGIVDFISSTFAYLTFYEDQGGGVDAVRSAVSQAVQACLASGLVAQNGAQLQPTPTAKVFAASSLSLASASQLAEALERATTTELSRQDLVFEVASCSEAGKRPWPRKRRRVEIDPRPSHAPDGSGAIAGSSLSAALVEQVLTSSQMASLVRARCLLEWMSGKGYREISAHFDRMGAAAARVRELGKNAAWLFETIAGAAEVNTAPTSTVRQLRSLALEARYGLPAELAPLARLSVPGISREVLHRLYVSDAPHDTDGVLDAADEVFQGLLTPLQLDRLRQAIVVDIEESLQRKHAGHSSRAEQVSLPRRLVDDLYTATGGGLEQAVTDALNQSGIVATRVLRQPHGEEDIQVSHPTGTVIVSVTASQDDVRPIKWNKAKEILGAGAGHNPVNYVCIGRPHFDGLAEQCASNIARETGERTLLLVPVPVLAEAIVRISEGALEPAAFADILASRRGLLAVDDLAPDLAS